MRTLRNQRGFTVIELMIVLVLVALLTAGGIMYTKWMREYAMMALVEADMRLIKTAASAFSSDIGQFPPDVWRGVDPGLSTLTVGKPTAIRQNGKKSI